MNIELTNPDDKENINVLFFVFLNKIKRSNQTTNLLDKTYCLNATDITFFII